MKLTGALYTENYLCRFDCFKAGMSMIDGMKAHYNYAKKHSRINNKTPAEAALIQVEETNKWKTLICNAASHRIQAGSVHAGTKSGRIGILRIIIPTFTSVCCQSRESRTLGQKGQSRPA